MIAMGHPDLFPRVAGQTDAVLVRSLEPAVEQGDAPRFGRHVCASELRRAVAALHAPAKRLHHHLLTIADAEDRHAKIEYGCGRTGGAFVDHARRTAGKDHRLRSEFLQEIFRHLLERVDFAIDAKLSQTAGDELRHLAAEVDDEKALMRSV